jgi:Ala-tRNA(Pro) deacylase
MSDMQNPLEMIQELLDQESVEYELLEHDPVHTSEEAAQVRGGSPQTGAKSLLLKSEVGFLTVVLQGDARLDSKKVTKHLGVSRNPRFATPEEVQQQMGCQVGACYPLAHLAGLRTIIDHPFTQQEYMSFNPGVHDKTITMSMRDYMEFTRAEVMQVSQ